MTKSAISLYKRSRFTADETSAQLGPSVRNNSAIVLCVGKHADRNDWRMSNTLEPFESEQSLFVGFGMASKEEFVPAHVRLSSSLQVLVAGNIRTVFHLGDYVTLAGGSRRGWMQYASDGESFVEVLEQGLQVHQFKSHVSLAT
ncbi:uncharacterized protein ARMOST_10012 [Armillaria ostoyae]|uniref:Uncharacterized protein n=1 Tax=Armillaria ostoyae TaxID=47428 RepID=A0A284RD74_ARMOS|nr:uncharacterized protein ARMOST_10012 [Armillaria ostoyae]